MPMIPYSILDLAPIAAGADAGRALRNSRDLAQHAEGWGYRRYWIAEHHNMTGIAGAATAVAIGFVAEGTTTIRVGAGGIMLPNHSPLVIAEQFGTLASLYPGRIDLGLGRAPGSDQATARALRRDPGAADSFPRDVMEVQHYFGPAAPRQLVRAVPGAGLEVPLWILGSSLFGAQLAAMLGLPFAFASHFAPALMREAAALYRAEFRASAQCPAPYLMLALNMVVAETDGEARRLFTSLQQQFIALRRGTPGLLPPPDEAAVEAAAPHERAGVAAALSQAVVGSPATARRAIQAFLDEHAPDELIVTAQIFDHRARLRSFEYAADILAAETTSRAPALARVG